MDNLLSIARELQLKVQSNEDSVHKVLSNAMHLQEVLHYSEEVSRICNYWDYTTLSESSSYVTLGTGKTLFNAYESPLTGF